MPSSAHNLHFPIKAPIRQLLVGTFLPTTEHRYFFLFHKLKKKVIKQTSDLPPPAIRIYFCSNDFGFTLDRKSQIKLKVGR